jgi:hypothetical protein
MINASSSRPPSQAIGRRMTTKRVFVDSAQRDRVAYPTPAEYEVIFQDDLYDVAAMQLVVADVPFPAYVIDARRAALALRLGAEPGSVPAVAQLDAGDYVSVADLAASLADALNAGAAAAGSSAYFWATVTGRTETVALWSTDAFALPAAATAATAAAAAGGPAGVLGFQPGVAYAATPYDPAAPPPGAPTQPVPNGSGQMPSFLLAAPYRANLTPVGAVVLDVKVPSTDVLASVNQAADRTFAVLYKSPATHAVNATSSASDCLIEKRWSAPQARVGRLRLRFTDLQGELYDFQNQDHRLELLFQCVAPPSLMAE